MDHRSLKVAKARRKVKIMAIMQKGGRCQHCGYDQCFDAMQFHHLDPTQKEFGIGCGNTSSWSKVKDELDKCILLCSNCHAEEHYRLKLCSDGQIGVVHLDQIIMDELLGAEPVKIARASRLREKSFSSRLKLVSLQHNAHRILPDIELLSKIYNQLGLSPNKIAFLYNVSEAAVRKKLKMFKLYIPREYHRVKEVVD